MKAKFIRGTTLKGKVIDEGAVLDLDELNYNLFVKTFRDAVPHVEPAKVDGSGLRVESPSPEPEAATATGESSKRGKK